MHHPKPTLPSSHISLHAFSLVPRPLSEKLRRGLVTWPYSVLSLNNRSLLENYSLCKMVVTFIEVSVTEIKVESSNQSSF